METGNTLWLILFVGGTVVVALVFAVAAAQRARFKRTPTGSLVQAAKDGDAGTVINALAEGTSINGEGQGFASDGTALHHAAGRGHIEVVKVLLDRGAAVNAEIKTPLFLAISNGHIEIAEMLLEHGASVDNNGLSLLYSAAAHSRDGGRLVRLLIDRGADPEKPCEDDVQNGFCSGIVKQLIKEAFDGSAGRACDLCKSVSPAASRDFVAYRSVSKAGPTGGVVVSSTITTRHVIATGSFRACVGCIEARSNATSTAAQQELATKLSFWPKWVTSRPRLFRLLYNTEYINPPRNGFACTRHALSLNAGTAQIGALLVAQQELLTELAQRWFDQTIASEGGVYLTSAEQFLRWAEISRVKLGRGTM